MKVGTMETIAEASHKMSEKKDFTPEEFAKAKTTCDFVIDLIKAISRSGYYDVHHPVSQEVKKGLYDAFKNALGSSAEIMLTCHDVEDQVDIHISGILNEPFNIRKLTHATTSDLFVPKLKDYFERKSLNSFVIKRNITSEHFESFIDIMSEPMADGADTFCLGEYLTKALADQDITEVSTIFKTDIVLSRGKLPWRVSIILRRLAKDLKTVPMFRSASAEKMKLIKKQIVEDIIRPLNNFDLLKDLIINCDIIVDHITHLLEVDEMENLMINSLPGDAVVQVAYAVLEVYEENRTELKSEEDDSIAQKRDVYLTKVLKIAAQRIVFNNMPDTVGLFERLYENDIVDVDMLPEKMRLDIQSKKIAEYIISEFDTFMEKAMSADTNEDMQSQVTLMKRVIPQFIRLKEWAVIKTIMETLRLYASRSQGVSEASDPFIRMPDAVLDGCEEAFADEFINADNHAKTQINDILMQLNSKCIDILSVVLSKGKETNVLKNAIDLLSQKGELARQWSIKILDDPNQSLAMMNFALLVITNVGRSDDVKSVKKNLRHPNASIRAKALAAVAKINKKDAEGVIMEALNDGEEKVRNQAAYLLEHELTVSQESAGKILTYAKEKLNNKNITAKEAGLISALLRIVGKIMDGSNNEYLESEIISMASDLLHERKGLLKFMSTELSREHEEIVCACASVLGKIGGTKSKSFLKTHLNDKTLLSNASREAIEEIDQKSVGQ
ncbi:MAG: hypothetical protein JW925_02165 [Syntrophaceae bacterium]|nr:hypothetical protein [Syntrophaceae bacterium]